MLPDYDVTPYLSCVRHIHSEHGPDTPTARIGKDTLVASEPAQLQARETSAGRIRLGSAGMVAAGSEEGVTLIAQVELSRRRRSGSSADEARQDA